MLREIEKGPNFEIYEGPLCIQRLDWTREGALRSTYIGHLMGECADTIIRRWEVMHRAKQPITMLHDAWDATGYESRVRVDLIEWGKKNPSAIAAVHILTQSKVVAMSVAVSNLVFPGLVAGYSKRIQFDVLAKKLGFALNPTMPKFTPRLADSP